MQYPRRVLWISISTSILLFLVTSMFYIVSVRSGPILLSTKTDPVPQKPGASGPPDISTEPPSQNPSPWLERNATRTLVIAQLQAEDTSWVNTLVQEDPYLSSAIYVVDNTSAPLTVLVNKGHEVMVYLTYIIDHYHVLSDVSIFMHAHQITWHNNDFLGSDSAQMVRHLKSKYVLQNGYMNMRCHLQPGCPDHIHPYVGKDSDDILNVPEAGVIGIAWGQLFPHDPVPSVLSQPCCGQFAVSADRMRRVPQQHYVDYRNWLLATKLDDRLSGRIWEYVWQWLFTGESEFCPVETICYCEGYGICFEPSEYQLYFQIRDEARKLEAEVQELQPNEAEPTTQERIADLKRKINDLHGRMNKIQSKAMDVPR
ncbi:hypothetical protein BDV28DRAFT_135219 [Aspergillus coremiiformis]|uniref:Uncharacterized protein n=1 Tax=Aspergillus coremiiformis TaxID=138285 RepID=A0A5N6Z440_9EURO|nr:hypothetical protein BDV28DRAFT_135219 [Aspergillus coremiiformis]